MPIYAYKCDACGHEKDVLQKLSDPQLTDCPSCGAAAFSKQVTAAGFQLKGSGWYVTDFRGDGKGGKPAAEPAAAESGAGQSDAAKPDGAKPDAAKPAESAKSEPAKSAKPAEPAAAKAPAPAAGSPSA